MNKDTEKALFHSFTICCGGRILEFERPAVMGILNVTPDSFYDGGRHQTASEYLDRAGEIVSEGADIIDIGAVSTRPGAKLLAPSDEALILKRVVGDVRREFPQAVISVDTCFSLPARTAVEAGADIVNDISGGEFDVQMFPVVAELGVPYVLMHNKATPDRMQDNPQYDNILEEVTLFLSKRVDTLRRLGVRDIIIDPGFGFAKTLEHNYQLFARLPELKSLFPNEPLLVAVSRKSMIYKLLGTTPDEALTGTVALHAAALLSGAQLLRVHDVREARETISVIEKLSSISQSQS